MMISTNEQFQNLTQNDKERIWASHRINHLFFQGMAPDKACSEVIGRLQVSHPDEDEGDCTFEFLEWVFGDNPAELERWHRLVNLLERPNWRIEGF